MAVAAAGWLSLRSSDPTAFAKGKRVELTDFHGPDPTGVPARLAAADLVARGEYLARAADCVACHIAPGGKPFAGGLAFRLPMIGTLYSTNITPDPETGIGKWSDDEFVRALHDGVGRGGEHLYPAFPYASYALMTRSDALAIKAYLFSLKPIKYSPPSNNMSFPFDQRYLMVFWNALFKPAHRFQPNTDQPAEWNNNHRKFAGAITQGWKAYNITPDLPWGIGSWSDEQLQGYLSRGHADGRGSAGGPMAEVVDYSLNFLSDADIHAMITYLKSVPSNSDARDDAAAPTPSSQQEVNSNPSEPIPNRGLLVFEGACTGCHGLDGKGAISTYASLLGGRAVNDTTGTNATQALLDGTRLRIAKTAGFMPEFGGGYSDREIAAVVNYLIGRFGKSASAVTPNDIAKRRQEN